jgi:hypothetical protein
MSGVLVNLRSRYSTGRLHPALDIGLLDLSEITTGRDYEGSEWIFHLEGMLCVGWLGPFADWAAGMNEDGVGRRRLYMVGG